MLRSLKRLVGGGRSGRMSSIGQDHNAGHKSYVENLPEEGRRWLRTKPFSAPPNYELGRCLHSFAHIVDNLALGAGSRVLDVGCGPGWISEWLARCGYQVTGVDISEDMLMVARERIAAITPEQLTVGANLQAEFVSLPVQQLDFEDYFDAAILYDAMHHFDDEVTTLSAIARSLVPGGRIYIHEGIRPRPGSKGERELIEEMEQYGTLEAPFDPDYLMDVVARSGFVHLRRLVEVDHLMPADQPARGGFGISRQLRSPSTNTIIGSTPMVGDGRDLSADLTLNESVIDDGRLVMSITARNAGSHRWSAAVDGHPVAGSVNVAPFLGSGDARRELPRVALPEAVDPGESMTIQFTLHLAALEGETDIGIDLVREQVAWFSDRGGTPLRVSVNG